MEATRQAIAAAAIACDWEALGALIEPTQFSFSFGADTDAIGLWEELEGDELGEPMRFLVETLKLNWVLDELPVEAELPDNYIWPDAFPMIWEDVTPEMRDARCGRSTTIRISKASPTSAALPATASPSTKTVSGATSSLATELGPSASVRTRHDMTPRRQNPGRVRRVLGSDPGV